MKNTKKIFALLFVVLTLAIMTLAVSAEEPIEFAFDVSSGAEIAQVGDTVTVTVSMANAPTTIKGMMMRPLYDDTALQLVTGKWGEMVTDNEYVMSAINCKPSTGELNAASMFDEPVDVNGEVFIMKFKVIAEGGEATVGVGVSINIENEEGNEEHIMGSDDALYSSIENGMSGTIVTPEKTVTPPDVDIDFVTFDGYAARKIAYNGVRAQYTLDFTKLAEVQKDYKVEIGMLLTSNPNGDDVAEAAYGDLTVDNNKQKSVFYTTDDGVVGKYYDKDETDNKIEYVYAVKFTSEGAETAERFNRALMFKTYVVLTDGDGNSFTYYVDTESSTFGYAISMADIAEHYTATVDENYPILQRVLSVCDGAPLAKMTVLNKDLDRYSIVINSASDMAVATALNNDFEAATGYRLPVIVSNGDVAASAHYDDAYIHIDIPGGIASTGSYKVTTADGNAIIAAKDVATATTAAKKFVETLVANNYKPFAAISHDGEWSPPIK